MQFPCRITRTLFQLFLGTVSLACFLSTVSGGLSKEPTPPPARPSVAFLQAKVRESAAQEMERIASKAKKTKTRLTSGSNDPRTLGMMDRVFDAIGMNSITWVPGLRSLMDMNSNGTQMEFIPLGRLLWKRFFGDSATSTLLGL